MLQLFGIEVLKTAGEQQFRLLLVAYQTRNPAQIVSAFHRNGHIGDSRKYRFLKPFRKIKHHFQNLLFEIDLKCDTVGVLKDLFAFFKQKLPQRHKIRTFGDGRSHIAVIVENRQPDTKSVLLLHDIIDADAVFIQPLEHIRACAGIIHNAQEVWLQIDIADILRNIPADTAVHLNHISDVAPGRNILRKRKALDINEYRSDYCDAHMHVSLTRTL